MANRSIALSKLVRSVVAGVPQVQTAGYHKNVIDHYENPRNVGSLDKNDPTVGTGIVGAPACGDVMKLQIKVNLSYGILELTEIHIWSILGR